MFTLPASIRRGARLDAVVRAVAAASGMTRLIYVERRGSLFRWSPAHRGGPYPLLRETAKVLGADHHALILPFRALGATGLTFIPNERSQTARELESWAVLEFESAQPPEVVRRRIRAALADV
jgi:hypothetical protein